jgi:hypothetical protein
MIAIRFKRPVDHSANHINLPECVSTAEAPTQVSQTSHPTAVSTTSITLFVIKSQKTINRQVQTSTSAFGSLFWVVRQPVAT